MNHQHPNSGPAGPTVAHVPSPNLEAPAPGECVVDADAQTLAQAEDLPTIDGSVTFADSTPSIIHDADAQDLALPEGTVIGGKYRIIQQIGGGGMGVVYLAVRETDFRQNVAIKLIRRGLDSDGIARRFKHEIDVLAALGKHPNIAALLDAGNTADGRPYFVMEFVDGQRIDDFATAAGLDIPARLRLFDAVCDAVAFAHRHAVIHRDIKPSNILVTVEGTPKLIDFGIAKLSAPGVLGDPDHAPMTRSGFLVLTPDYASPEQVRGESLTTASDVYSLGVVLYELVTGSRPYRLTGKPLDEVFRIICDRVVERPSARV